MYDCTNEASYDNITNWLQQIDQHASPDITCVLVANQIDKPDRKVTTEQGQSLADKHRMTFFEVSAMDGTNVPELFYHVARLVIKDKPALTHVGGSSGSRVATQAATTNFSQDSGRIELSSAQSNSAPN